MPAPALAPFMPWLATAGFGWLYYRRIRRQFGRQPYRPTRTAWRIGLLSLVGCGLLVAGFAAHRLAPAIGTGAIAGAVLGWLASRHTQVAVVDGVRGYTPNPWIGGLISLLLVARLAWRWQAGAFAVGAQQAGSQASPLTMGMLAALVAYYLVTGISLVRRMRALPAHPDAGGGDGGAPRA